MSFSIRSESIQNSKLVSDIDNFRSKYLDYDIVEDIYCTAPAFEIYSLEKNKFVLMKDCSLEKFRNNWKMRPDYASYDIYGTVIYWPIILFANNLNCIEDFNNLEQILVPSFASIMKVLRNRVPSSDMEKPEAVKIPRSVAYLKKSPLDDFEIQKMISDKIKEDFDEAETENEESIPTLTDSETIVVLPSMIENSGKRLTNVPVDTDEVTAELNGEPITNGVDFIVKDQNFISWDTSDVPEATVSIVEDDVLVVTYEHYIINEYVHELVLTSEDLENKYIVLPYNPINVSSIELYIDGFNVPQRYGYEYILSNDNTITWDVDTVRNSILNDSLIEGDKLVIKFLFKYLGEEV